MLQKIDLGREAIDYIRGQLSDGNALGDYLLALPLSESSVATIAPSTVDTALLHEFAKSVSLRTGVSIIDQVRARIVACIVAFLGSTDENHVIFETFLRQGDANLIKNQSPYFTTESTVYYFANRHIADGPSLEKMVMNAGNYPFVAALTSTETGSNITHGEELSGPALSLLAAHSDHVLVGAYDAEGFIVWSRPTKEFCS